MTRACRIRQSDNLPRQRAVGLVELMVALAAGLSLSLAAIAIYLDNKHAWSVRGSIAGIQENGRFALNLLREDVRLSGYWGLNTSPATIELNEPVVLSGECFPGWATQFNVAQASTDDSNAGYDGCIPDSDHVRDTDILTLRRSSTETLEPGLIRKNHLYLYTSLTEGVVFSADEDQKLDTGVTLEEGPAALFAVMAHAYYLRPWSLKPGDGTPTLVREIISADRVTAEPLVEQIEDLQFSFGIDGNGDGNVDSYKPGGLDATDADRVVTVVVEMLVRANRIEAGYVNANTYRIGGRDRTFGDGFRRRVFRESVYLRNRRKAEL